jgi:pectate lyase
MLHARFSQIGAFRSRARLPMVARNNFFVNSGSGQTGGSVAAIPYSYSLDSASSVKSSVTNGAGVGRVSG